MIIVDSREPEKFRKIGDRVEDIQVDYIVEGEYGKYAIERKTLEDLIASVRSGRLWKQLDRLIELEENYGYEPVLVIHGNIYKRMRARFLKMSLSWWIGTQLAILRKGVGVIYLPSEDAFEALIKTIDKKVGEQKEWSRPHICKKSNRDIREEAEDMICAVNGIGRKTGKDMLKVFGSVKGVVNAEYEELKHVIGERLAKHFIEVVQYRYDDIMRFDGGDESEVER